MFFLEKTWFLFRLKKSISGCVRPDNLLASPSEFFETRKSYDFFASRNVKKLPLRGT
jgi:hypothetical protein